MNRARLMVVVLCSALGCRAEILLKGIMIQNETPLFSLYLEEDQTSKWVLLGKSFAGFKVVDFDPQREVLTVVKDESRKELRMEQSQIKDSVADANARLKTAQGVELAYELLRQKDRLLLGLNADQRLLLRGLVETVRLYQITGVRIRELEIAQSQIGTENEKVGLGMAFVKRQSEEIRRQIEEMANDLKTAAAKIPASGVDPTALSSREAELAVEREKSLKAEELRKAAEERIEKQMREMGAQPGIPR